VLGAALFIVVAALAALIPAHRASQTAPAVALLGG
jgi:ABC-type lipoprotein release transport system permease subunit